MQWHLPKPPCSPAKSLPDEMAGQEADVGQLRSHPDLVYM
jgi:hypothetical protein